MQFFYNEKAGYGQHFGFESLTQIMFQLRSDSLYKILRYCHDQEGIDQSKFGLLVNLVLKNEVSL